MKEEVNMEEVTVDPEEEEMMRIHSWKVRWRKEARAKRRRTKSATSWRCSLVTGGQVQILTIHITRLLDDHKFVMGKATELNQGQLPPLFNVM